MLLTGCPLLLLEPSKKVRSVLQGALTMSVVCVNTDVELDSHLSVLLAGPQNYQLKDVVVPLLADYSDKQEKNDKC